MTEWKTKTIGYTEYGMKIGEVVELTEVEAEIARLRAILVEIEKGEGPFSLDNLTHAENCIEAMKALARKGW